MIKIILISSLAVLSACAVCKEKKVEKKAAKVQNEVSVDTEKQNEVQERPLREEDLMNIIGTVRTNQSGCPVVIEMVQGDLFSIVYPVNLDSKYLKEGLQLKFSYAPSRAASPEGCKVDMVVALSDIEVVK